MLQVRISGHYRSRRNRGEILNLCLDQYSGAPQMGPLLLSHWTNSRGAGPVEQAAT
jgi:hypothetical protein